MTTGEKIKFFRRENKMSQEELSKLIHKSLRTVQHYEADSVEVPRNTLNLIANIFNVCLIDMLPETPLPGMPEKKYIQRNTPNTHHLLRANH